MEVVRKAVLDNLAAGQLGNKAVITDHTKDSIFKPNLSRMEAQKAATDRSAKAILSAEKSAVDAKTLRLRAARLARDQNDNNH